MPIESATYISDLNASNPVGSTDKVQTLDDHVRLIKSTVKASFPGITGAVTPTHTELNYVDGVTSAIQTQIDGKAASSHNHSAADLTSGTVPDARFPATLPAASGANLTSLNGTNVSSGTVADARLSSNVPLKNAPGSFTVAPNLNVAAGTAALQIASWDVFKWASSATLQLGGVTGSQWDTLALYTNGSAKLTISSAGAVTTPGALASEVGYQGAPRKAKTADHTIVAADDGCIIHCTSACDQVTVQDSGGIPDGGCVGVLANIAAPVSIVQGSGATLYLAGTAFGTSGSRTVGDGCLAYIYRFGSNYIVGGAGVS